MRTDFLKQFIYAVPGLPKRERVVEIIHTIEQACNIAAERVALQPEFVNCKVSCPIKFSLPTGIVSARPKHGGDRVIDYAPGVWRDPSAKALLRLSEFADVSITVELKKFKRDFRCRLDVKQGVCSISVELANVTGMEKAERIENLRKISELLGLPVEFLSPTRPPTGRDGLTVTVAYLKTDACSAELCCDLSQKLYAEVLRKLVTEGKGKIDCWRIEDVRVAPFPKLIAEINRVGFPSKKTEMDFTWRLRCYRDFADLTEMAARNEYGEVTQSMFEFRFANGKQGQFDIAANKKGGFKLWFSFDTKADQLEFVQLTGIKLKEEH